MDKPPIKKPLISSIEQPEEKIEKSEFVLENGEKPLFEMTLELDKDKTPQQYETEITNLEYNISDIAKYMLQNMKPLEQSETVDIVSFTVAQLGFTESTLYSKIKERALELGLKLCPQQVGPQLRTTYTDQANGNYLRIAMEAIPDVVDNPRIWEVRCYFDGHSSLCGDRGREVSTWSPEDEFVFSK